MYVYSWAQGPLFPTRMQLMAGALLLLQRDGFRPIIALEILNLLGLFFI